MRWRHSEERFLRRRILIYIPSLRSALFLLFITPAFAANPFHLGKVQYFPEDKQHLKETVDQMQQTIDWREPVMGANGTMTEYIPPTPVLRLLDDPTPANAQAYLDWQEEKSRRITRAQRTLDELIQEKKP